VTEALLQLAEFCAELNGALLEGVVFGKDFLFRAEDGELLSGAANAAQVIVEFLDFEEIENLLGFEDAILFEKEVS